MASEGGPGAAAAPENPQYVGVVASGSSSHPWTSHIWVNTRHHKLVKCSSRAAAAAARDLALIWCRLRGTGLGTHRAALNFPQLLADRPLQGQLEAAADVPALKAAIAGWLQQQWPQQQVALLAGRAAALSSFAAETCQEQGICRLPNGLWKSQMHVANQTLALGSFIVKQEATVVWDAANVWRRMQNTGSSAKTSRTFNHPQLRLWEDEQLLAGLQGVQDATQLKTFLKAWAQQHLPAKLAQLQAAAGQQQGGASGAGAVAANGAGAAGPAGGGAAPPAADGGQPAGGLAASQVRQVAAAHPSIGRGHGHRRTRGQAAVATTAAAAAAAAASAADPETSAEGAAGGSSQAGRAVPAGELSGGQQASSIPPTEVVAASAGGAGAGAGAGAAAAALQVPAAAALAAIPLPDLGSLEEDGGPPTKRHMLCKLQPLLKAAGASDQHLSDFELAFLRHMSDEERHGTYDMLRRARGMPDAAHRVLQFSIVD